jgi:ribosome-binding factor A
MTRSDHRRTGAAPSQRQLRVGELIRHALADVLARGEVHDPEIEAATITVTEVTLTPDLKLATCYVMPLGETDIDRVVEALQRHRKFLRGAVTKRIDLRFSPDIRFRVDTSFETGEKIDALLRSPAVRRDLTGDDSDDS